MASEITPKVWNYQHEVPVKGRFLKAATSDWIVLPYPGAANIRGNLYTGAQETTLTFGTAAINNSGTAYTATDTSIVVTTGKITRQVPYYIQTTSGEIIMVVSESAVGSADSTLKVIRGCLGTTASLTGVAHTNTVYIKNIVVFGQATTGYVDFEFNPLPMEPKAKLFA